MPYLWDLKGFLFFSLSLPIWIWLVWDPQRGTVAPSHTHRRTVSLSLYTVVESCQYICSTICSSSALMQYGTLSQFFWFLFFFDVDLYWCFSLILLFGCFCGLRMVVRLSPHKIGSGSAVFSTYIPIRSAFTSIRLFFCFFLFYYSADS